MQSLDRQLPHTPVSLQGREKVGESASIDIIEDPTLREGGCLIETDGGVFDCSVETELESLVKDLKALSIG